MDENILKQKKKIGISLGIFLIISYLAAYALTFLVKKLNIANNENKYLVTYIINAISIYLIGYLFTKLILKNTDEIEKKEKKKLKFSEFLLLVCITIGGAQITNIATQMIMTIVKSIFKIEINNDITTLIQESSTIYLIIFAAILGPIFEELIFRGTMLKKLRVYGDKTAILYTAIAFGLFHCNISQIPFAIVCGLILGYVVVKTNNIIYPIILHIILNSISVILTTLLKLKLWPVIVLIMLFVLTCIILTLVFVPIKLATNKVKIENESKYKKKNLYKNIGYIFSIIVVIILTMVEAI